MLHRLEIEIHRLGMPSGSFIGVNPRPGLANFLQIVRPEGPRDFYG